MIHAVVYEIRRGSHISTDVLFASTITSGTVYFVVFSWIIILPVNHNIISGCITASRITAVG